MFIGLLEHSAACVEVVFPFVSFWHGCCNDLGLPAPSRVFNPPGLNGSCLGSYRLSKQGPFECLFHDIDGHPL